MGPFTALTWGQTNPDSLRLPLQPDLKQVTGSTGICQQSLSARQENTQQGLSSLPTTSQSCKSPNLSHGPYQGKEHQWLGRGEYTPVMHDLSASALSRGSEP